MKSTWIRAALVVAALTTTLVACGDDDGGGDVDAGRADAGRADAGRSDSGTTPTEDGGFDAGGEDAGDVDGGDVDGGDVDGGADDAGTDGGGADAGTTDGGVMVTDPAATSAQIGAVRAADDGTIDLDIDEAVVTYLKPAVGTDPEGFFLQAQPDGPAVFVAIAAATLTPAPEVGDVVSFTATEVASAQGRRQITMVSGWAVLASGFDVSTLAVDRSAATDLVSALGTYEAELIQLNGTITGAFVGSGTGHEAAPIDTAGVTGSADLLLRMPTTLRESLDADVDLEPGCDFTATAPMWRFNARAQLSVYFEPDDIVVTCPAPTVDRASAISGTSVAVVFDRAIDPASVMASGAQFTITGGVTVSAAALSDRTVTLTTSALTSGTTYTVTVAASVTDLAGAAVDASANTATFTYSATLPCTGVVINELRVAGPGGAGDEFIELVNCGATDVPLSGYRLVYRSAMGTTDTALLTIGAVTLAPGGYALFANSGFTGTTVDGAFASGLAAGGGGIQLRDMDGAVLDSMGYGTATNAFVEGTAAPVPPSGQSVSRTPNGTDTGANAADFAVSASTPRAPNI
ncbi:lamin tail domain-containing protein [Sandaracinus amylolyticus]|uniref:lamin tail domain-containing protein n=1 Tax=Sandaracinus amylolyticus TaxID=927083 RepID=UPI001F2AAC03|nr:lamin tail domain-containing protein [Sandaracinus amylolyticus]UJR78202.1 Hemagglutinin protein [Sandaracinus amylolyticus]